MRPDIRAVVLAILVTWGADARAQGTAPPRDLAHATIEDLMNITVEDLMNITVEDLMNITVTSASRKEQRLGDVPAAIYVITQDDIRRSGMTTVPELLRLASCRGVPAYSWPGCTEMRSDARRATGFDSCIK